MRRSLSRRRKSSVRSSMGQPQTGRLSQAPPSRLPVPVSRPSSAATAAASSVKPQLKPGGFAGLPNLRRTSSMLPYGSGRPSSVSAKGGAAMKDHRPLLDKGYQSQLIKKLKDFLTKTNYPYPVTHKQLQSPSSREFVSMFQYVYSFIDSSCKLTAKFDEEIPLLLKQIGYPFGISKKSLLSVGSTFTWPHLLGVFSFLIDVIGISCACDESLFSDANDFGCHDDDDDWTPKELEAELRKVSGKYCKYLNGTLDLEDVDAEVDVEIDQEYKQGEEDVRNIQKEIEHLETEYEMAQQEEFLVEDYQQKYTALSEDRDKFREFIVKSTDRIKFYEKKLDEQLEVVHVKELEIAAIKLHCEEQEEIVANQSMDINELNSLKQETNKLEAEHQRNKENAHVARQESQCLDMKYSKTLASCEKAVDAVNKMSRELQLIPPMAANAKGRDFSVKLDLCAGSDKHRRTALSEMKGTLLPLIEIAIEEDEEVVQQLKSTEITEQSECTKLQEAVDDRQITITRLKTEIDHMERKVKRLEKETTEKAKEIQAGYSTALSDLEQIHLGDNSAVVEEKKRELKILYQSFQDLKLENEREYEAELTIFNGLKAKVEAHMQKLQRFEEEMLECLVTAMEKSNAISMPTDYSDDLEDL
ncbi:kinetochore protein NDC80 homolog [Corticium candelabrum]|uniref:kinetochore protein NDC80 homolog n=1 Tax=Corticium candelabrum TaxID=121492 RepID=UPI002E258E42|nr:kinetochore protein NDC80 homolog [Corticium candelabrum]